MRLIKNTVYVNGLIILLSIFYVSGCMVTKVKPNIKKEKQVYTKHNFYYGTYTRVGHNGSFFVDGKSGELWYLKITPKGIPSFYKKLDIGLRQLGKLHKVEPVFNVELIGSLSDTPSNDPGLKSHPYFRKYYPSKFLHVDKVLKFSVARQFNPANCFTTGVPCSSIGMARYKK